MLDRPTQTLPANRTGVQTSLRQRQDGMWIYRKVRFDPAFPKPLVINQRHYFDEDELDNYDRQRREK